MVDEAEAPVVVIRGLDCLVTIRPLQPPRVLLVVEDNVHLIHTRVPQQPAAVDKRGGLELERAAGVRSLHAAPAAPPTASSADLSATTDAAARYAICKPKPAEGLPGMLTANAAGKAGCHIDTAGQLQVKLLPPLPERDRCQETDSQEG
jgi:hypothetical protein